MFRELMENWLEREELFSWTGLRILGDEETNRS